MTSKIDATRGLQAALSGLNAAAVAFYEAYGRYPRIVVNVSELLVSPLNAINAEDELVFAPLVEMDRDTADLMKAVG